VGPGKEERSILCQFRKTQKRKECRNLGHEPGGLLRLYDRGKSLGRPGQEKMNLRQGRRKELNFDELDRKRRIKERGGVRDRIPIKTGGSSRVERAG